MSKVIKFSDKELNNLIDREARKRLGISGYHFTRQYKAGILDTCKPAVGDIGMLLKLKKE